jgi:hypothetical protein
LGAHGGNPAAREASQPLGFAFFCGPFLSIQPILQFAVFRLAGIAELFVMLPFFGADRATAFLDLRNLPHSLTRKLFFHWW